MWRRMLFTIAFLPLTLAGDGTVAGPALQLSQQERDRRNAREVFSKNFREIQLLGLGLLRNHEAGNLDPKKLEKTVRSINKCARTIEPLLALGELGSLEEYDREINTPAEFNDSILRLAGLIRDFARNPSLKDNKIFNTRQAAEARSHLLTIIDLSKTLAERARSYSTGPTGAR